MNIGIFSGVAGLLAAVFAVGAFVANILIAIGVFQDASGRKRSGKRLVIMSPGFWTCVCLFTSVAGLAMYWVAHYSTLARESE